MSVFHWLYKFGLDVLLGIDAKILKTQVVQAIKLKCNSTNIMEDLKKNVIVKAELSFIGSMDNFMLFRFCGTKVIPLRNSFIFLTTCLGEQVLLPLT